MYRDFSFAFFFFSQVLRLPVTESQNASQFICQFISMYLAYR
jgi:hypothetical protein